MALRVAYALIRYAIALVLLFYGFAKLNGSQFTILDSELDKPMRDVSVFWLTWYYFGYSSVYGGFVALVQIGGAILLFFRKTTLLGACLLVPVVSNIILIDFFYGIDEGALAIALMLMVGLTFLLYLHRRDLLDLFWGRQNSVVPAGSSSWKVWIGKGLIRASPVVFAALGTYWIANYNNRQPTPLDGAWTVVGAEPEAPSSGLPSTVFFEHNRAYLCVFKLTDGSYQWHHFEVDPASHSIQIWRTWLTKGAGIFRGTYELSGSTLSLKGVMNGRENVNIALRKR